MGDEVGEVGGEFLLGGGALSEVDGGFEKVVHDIGDVGVFSAEAHGLDDFGEELSGFAGEWGALGFFTGAWVVATEEDISIEGACSEDGLGIGFGVFF